MESVLAWLNEPLNKTVLMFLGGLILKKWPAFVNKAIPLVLLAVSILLAALKSLWPVLVPDAHAATMVAAVSGGGAMWKNFLTDALVPVVFSVGTHSAAKNTREWWAVGWKLWTTARR